MSKTKKIITSLLTSALTALEAGTVFQIFIHLKAYHLYAVLGVMALVFILAFAVSLCYKKSTIKKQIATVLIIPILVSALGISSYGIWRNYNYEFSELDSGKESLYSSHKVMLIVPHQDDDTFILGGVIEEYIKYGSDVYFVFTTAGDFKGVGEERMREAIKVMDFYGIPEENVIFLGYGDTLKYDGKHIYNTSNIVAESNIKKKNTYGLPSHPAYSDGSEYSRENIKNDIKSVISEYMPEVIYAIDYDRHADHKCYSLLFEEAMGEILKERKDYKPVVFKAFAYKTALYAENDFFNVNIKSTVNPFKTDYLQQTNVYLWNDRVRFPLVVSRYKSLTPVYKALEIYKTQNFNEAAYNATNGDKVAWLRETSSILYDSEISVSSGNGTVLNDFKLTDSSDILIDETPISGCGVWIPQSGDTEKVVTVKLKVQQNIKKIRLYDNPSVDDNITDAKIIFDDGNVIETKALAKNGSATEIAVDKKNVNSFTLVITKTEGVNPGLSEIEAFSEDFDCRMSWIKIMDNENDFVYDYYLETDEQEFNLYSYGVETELTAENFTVVTDNKNCSAEIKNGKIAVSCPKGETCMLTVSDKNGNLSDTVKLTNNAFKKSLTDLAMRIEDYRLKVFDFDEQKKYLPDILVELLDRIF